MEDETMLDFVISTSIPTYTTLPIGSPLPPQLEEKAFCRTSY
jgi:hypothetical protein